MKVDYYSQITIENINAMAKQMHSKRDVFPDGLRFPTITEKDGKFHVADGREDLDPFIEDHKFGAIQLAMDFLGDYFNLYDFDSLAKMIATGTIEPDFIYSKQSMSAESTKESNAASKKHINPFASANYRFVQKKLIKHYGKQYYTPSMVLIQPSCPLQTTSPFWDIDIPKTQINDFASSFGLGNYSTTFDSSSCVERGVPFKSKDQKDQLLVVVRTREEHQTILDYICKPLPKDKKHKKQLIYDINSYATALQQSKFINNLSNYVPLIHERDGSYFVAPPVWHKACLDNIHDTDLSHGCKWESNALNIAFHAFQTVFQDHGATMGLLWYATSGEIPPIFLKVQSQNVILL